MTEKDRMGIDASSDEVFVESVVCDYIMTKAAEFYHFQCLFQ